MFYVGLDIHAKHIAMCVLTEVGKIYRLCQVRTIDEMMQTLERLPDRFEVCYEASCGYGHYHDLLRPLADGANNSLPRDAGQQPTEFDTACWPSLNPSL